MGKIYLNISGGCIQSVHSTNKKDTVEIWDWDNIREEVEDVTALEKEWDKLIVNLHEIATN